MSGTHLAERPVTGVGEFASRTFEGLRHFGSGVLDVVAVGTPRFEARMAQILVDRDSLEQAARRGDMAPAVRDELLARHAIDPRVVRGF